METDGHVEKQSTVFPHVLAKRLGAFCTVPTGFTAVNPQTTKPDISLATKTGHFYLLPTDYRKHIAGVPCPSPSGRGRRGSQQAGAPGEGCNSRRILRPSPLL